MKSDPATDLCSIMRPWVTSSMLWAKVLVPQTIVVWFVGPKRSASSRRFPPFGFVCILFEETIQWRKFPLWLKYMWMQLCYLHNNKEPMKYNVLFKLFNCSIKIGLKEGNFSKMSFTPQPIHVLWKMWMQKHVFLLSSFTVIFHIFTYNQNFSSH